MYIHYLFYLKRICYVKLAGYLVSTGTYCDKIEKPCLFAAFRLLAQWKLDSIRIFSLCKPVSNYWEHILYRFSFFAIVISQKYSRKALL